MNNVSLSYSSKGKRAFDVSIAIQICQGTGPSLRRYVGLYGPASNESRCSAKTQAG